MKFNLMYFFVLSNKYLQNTMSSLRVETMGNIFVFTKPRPVLVRSLVAQMVKNLPAMHET